MGAVVSKSIVEKSMANSWISSCVCSTVISCMRLKYGMAASRNDRPIAVRSRRGSGVPGAGRSRSGEDGLEALPVGERPQGGVGGEEVVQVGRAGSGEPADDDRGGDPLVEDLGVAPEQVLDQEAVLEQPQDERVLLHDARPVEPALLAHGAAQHVEAIHEVRGAEVVEARLRRGRRP